MKALQKIEADGTFYWSYVEIEEVEPAKPIPEIPPPVWDSRPIDAQRCMDAIHALCKAA